MATYQERNDPPLCRALVMLSSTQASARQRDDAMRTLWPILRMMSQDHARRQAGRDLDDAHQHLMIRIVRSAHRYDAQQPPTPWLRRIAFTAAMEAHKMRGSEIRRCNFRNAAHPGRPSPVVLMEDIWPTDDDDEIKANLAADTSTDAPDVAAERRERIAHAKRVLIELRSMLTPLEFSSYVGVTMYGTSYVEIAQRHDTTIKAVDNAMRRARLKVEDPTLTRHRLPNGEAPKTRKRLFRWRGHLREAGASSTATE